MFLYDEMSVSNSSHKAVGCVDKNRSFHSAVRIGEISPSLLALRAICRPGKVHRAGPLLPPPPSFKQVRINDIVKDAYTLSRKSEKVPQS
jgi:hypothetical protein